MSRCLLQNAKLTPPRLSKSLVQPRRVQGYSTPSRRLASTSAATGPSNYVRVVECGARDGLQNEPNIVDVETKLELIDRLALAGLKSIESGSMVSKKSVPQMGTTKEVLFGLKKRPGVSYPVLIPNLRGMTDFLDLQDGVPIVDEVSIFTAASDSFSKANTKMTVDESLATLEKVVVLAKEKGLRIRGYVSTVITCPFEGAIKPSRVTAVAKQLLDMGCYEISLGDTVGTGTEMTVRSLMDDVTRQLPVDKLAVHNHDTFGMAVANVMTALQYGIRTVDGSVAGLGGCPFSPGATGNAATEDLVHALHGAGYETGIDMKKLVQTGEWISEKLARRNESRAGRGWSARWKREQKLVEKSAAS